MIDHLRRSRTGKPEQRVSHRRNADRIRVALVGILTVLVVVECVAIGVLALQSTRDHGATQKAALAAERALVASQRATAAERNAVQAKQLAQVINQERRQTILETCNAQNARHDGTIRALNSIYQHPVHPARIPGIPSGLQRAFHKLMNAQSRAGRAPTMLLINALVPRQDCARVAARATTSS